MHIFKRKSDLAHFLEHKSTSVGFVPTMGALHPGHISLINQSHADHAITVCSIYVNPTQFNNPVDFDTYPNTIVADIELLIDAHCDVLFLPSTDEMYPMGIHHIKQYELGYLNTILEGPNRPGHFNGVCAIVHQLLEAVLPNQLYLGEKDFQQCMVIKQLVSQLHLPVQITTCPTLREHDGLAMSSRNIRLSAQARKLAPLIYKTLQYIQQQANQLPFNIAQQQALHDLQAAGFHTSYLEIADANTLELLHEYDLNKSMVVLIATQLENVRLIDNLRIN